MIVSSSLVTILRLFLQSILPKLCRLDSPLRARWCCARYHVLERRVSSWLHTDKSKVRPCPANFYFLLVTQAVSPFARKDMKNATPELTPREVGTHIPVSPQSPAEAYI